MTAVLDIARRSAPPAKPGALSVVHVVLSLDVGGLERIVVALIRQGTVMGQRVTVICLERPGDLATEAQAAGARIVCMNKLPGLRPGLVKQIAGTLSKLNPDVIHTHQAAALLYAGRAARRLGIPVLHTEHGKHYGSRWKTRLMGRLAARCADRFCCVSADIAAEVIRCNVAPQSKVSVVANGIDVDAFTAVADKTALRRSLGLPAAGILFGTIGRLSEVKRQDMLIRAFGGVRARLPDAHLLIVGDGPKRFELHALATELGLTGSIHFAGYQSDPQRFLAAMDVFALTSQSEGMPLVILEAWAAQIPLIASRVGGLPELIDHPINGLLFDAGDTPALVEGLIALATQSSLAAGLSAAGLQKVNARFHIRQTAENYQRHYLQVAGVE